jgi:hypothetical protein
LRYYSPKIGGIATVGIQLQEDGETEIALRTDFAGFRFNAFIESKDTVEDVTGFLLAYKAPIGLSITYVSSEDEGNSGSPDSKKHSGWKVGYQNGKHAISYSKVSLDQTDETIGRKDDESTGISYIYNMDKGVQLWVGYKETEKYTDLNVKSEDDGIAIGGRV